MGEVDRVAFDILLGQLDGEGLLALRHLLANAAGSLSLELSLLDRRPEDVERAASSTNRWLLSAVAALDLYRIERSGVSDERTIQRGGLRLILRPAGGAAGAPRGDDL